MRRLPEPNMGMSVPRSGWHSDRRGPRRERRRIDVWSGSREIVVALAAIVLALSYRGVSAQEDFEGWNLEPGVRQAHLVMVARVASISRVTVVEGAKTDVALREYRFQPIRRLKGVFQRDQLSMTAADLGCPASDGDLAPSLKEGEFRLLILAQPRLGILGCVSAAPGATTFDQRVPRVTGPDDPLVAVIETLIQVADSRSRRERAAFLVERLQTTRGAAAIPLLSSLRLRADWAAADPRAFPAVARLMKDSAPAVRDAALELLRDMLASRMAPDDPQSLGRVAGALRELLTSDKTPAPMRLPALEALGHLLAIKADEPWPRELLIRELTTAATYAERAAAATALAHLAHAEATTALLDALAGLPLDELPAREAVYARAAVQSDARRAERILLTRLERSIAARQSLEAEIEPLGRMRGRDSLPLLLTAADQAETSPKDRHRIAWALGRLDDDRALPVLIGWLRGADYQLKEPALAALENLDSDAAAREARPLLKSEAHLPFKLRLARLLARHGMADGYALATEHLADSDQTAAATLVLAALNDPRTTHDLSVILAARPDRAWRAAALTGLAAIGDLGAREELLTVLKDDRDPLAADAAEAAGLAGDAELLPPLATLVRSRNRQIAVAALTALRRFLGDVRTAPRGLAGVVLGAGNPDDGEPLPPIEVPEKTRAALADAVGSLVTDAYVDLEVRRAAFAVARLLGSETYPDLLAELADQAELEGTPLLAEVSAERRRLHDVAKRP